MPEGDTVFRFARLLDETFAGDRLTGADLRVPAYATADLTGWTVTAVRSRGKHFLIRLAAHGGAAWTLHVHLRMDGAWRITRAAAAGERQRSVPGASGMGAESGRTGPARRPVHEIRLVLRTATATAVGFHLHEVALVRTADEGRLVGHLGPDLLGPDWDPAEAVRRIAARPDRVVGAALLDQRNLAGLGNIYTSETLFLRGVSPWTPVAEVRDGLARTVVLAHELLDANKARTQTVTTGDPRRGRGTWAYGRTGAPCRRCGTRIRRGPVVLDDPVMTRPVYWCPSCQPGPGPGPLA